VIARKDLRQRLRDRSAIVVAVVAPVVLSSILTFALGGGTAAFTPTFAVAVLDEGDIGTQFADALLGPGLGDVVETVDATDDADVARLIETGEADAGFVLPPETTADILAGRRPTITVLRDASAPVAGAVAEAIAEGFVARVSAGQVAVATTIALDGAPPDPAAIAALAERAQEGDLPLTVDAVVVDDTGAGQATYFASGMAVFFLFFTVAYGAKSLLAERDDGTLARLLTAPIRPSSVIAGKALGSFVLGLASITTVVLFTTLAVGARWGDPIGVAIMVLAVVVAAQGVTAAVSTFARTPEQAEGYASAVSVVLALIGGSFFSLSQAPEALQALNRLTPNGWALRGFGQLAFESAGAVDILPAAAATAAFGVVTGAIALVRARRIVDIR